jgi:serine phosphatase RsbU (regulator of sigma subunit)
VASESAKVVADTVYEETTEFRGSSLQTDDVTIVAVRITT